MVPKRKLHIKQRGPDLPIGSGRLHETPHPMSFGLLSMGVFRSEVSLVWSLVHTQVGGICGVLTRYLETITGTHVDRNSRLEA